MMSYSLRSTTTFVAAVLVCFPAGAGKLLAQEKVSETRIVDSIDESRLVTLTGNTPPQARAKNDLGRLAPDLAMGDLVLVLKRSPELQAAFNSYVASEYKPGSANYHHWLTAEEVGAKFGPSRTDVETISNWLRDHGFSMDAVSKDRLSIRFSGTASQVEATFHTEIHQIETRSLGAGMSATREAEKHIANMSDPKIPAALTPVVAGVKALHNFFPHPLHRLGAQVSLHTESGNVDSGARERVGAPPVVPTKTPGMAAMTGPRPQFGTVNGYGDQIEDVTPYDFATIYNVLPLWNATTVIDGTGQSIAIAGTSNINLADVAAFRSAFGLPAKTPSVVITNSDPGDCPGFDSNCAGGLVENTLDVEWSGAVAKGANIILVTSSAPTATSDPLYLSEDYIVENKTAPVMNVSYGECELVLGTAGNTLYNNLWQTAASEGIAVFVATGDAGSPACDQDFDQTDGVPYAAQFGLAVSGIASTPYNTAVGGTDFNWGTTAAPYWNSTNSGTGASAVGYIPEVPWNETCTNPLILPELQADAAYVGVAGVQDAESACNFVIESWSYINTNYGANLSGLVDTIGSGGGASNCTVSNGYDPLTCSGGWAKPTWQAGVPGILSDSRRDIPDVSFFASDGFLGSSYLICVSGGGSSCSYSATAEPTAQEVGGTSVASPAMAGVMAMINQKSASSQGNPNTLLYKLASEQTWSGCSTETVTAASSCIFNDIDSGTNAMACANGSAYCTVIYAGDPAGILAGYGAGTGYDAATGLGSLNVANVVNLWPTSTSSPVVSLSPASLTFPTTTDGVAAATQTITLKNTGKSALTLSGTGNGISIGGANPTDFTQTNTCGTSLAAGASCAITVTFKPLTVGALSASLLVADNAFGSPQPVSLTGTGVAAGSTAVLSANTLTFATTTVGSTNVAPAITLTNAGTAILDISSIGITGTNATSYSETHTCGTTLGIGVNCSITITFKPLAAGALSASLSIADNATGSPQTLPLSGTGALTVTLTPASLTFASTPEGVASAAQLVTLKNTSAAVVTVGSTSFSGTDASSFIKSASTCGATLAIGASCTISVELNPTTTGALTAALNVADNATGSPQSVTLSGTGSTPPVTLSLTNLAFAATAVGSASGSQLVTMTNTGTVALTIASIAVTGTNATSFVFANSCGTSLAVGANCTIHGHFAPTAGGVLKAVITITDNAAGSPQTIALSGTGVVPPVTLSAASLSYGSVNVGGASGSQSVTMTNSGTAALTITGIAVTGTDGSSFVFANTCGTSLAVGANCTIHGHFAPAAGGALTAAVTITDSATGSPQSIKLSGTGVAPPVTLSATKLAYPATTVGSSSSSQSVTMTNTGTAALTITSIAVTGTDASSFVFANSCGTSLAVGANCTIHGHFAPKATGALTAAVTITDSATGSPQSIALSGTGQ